MDRTFSLSEFVPKRYVSMTEQGNFTRGSRFLIITAALAIIIWGVNQAQSALASFLVAVFLAVIGTPLLLWLERKRVPSIVAVLLVVSGMIAILMIVGGFVGASLSKFTGDLPSYQQRIQKEVLTFDALLVKKGLPAMEKILLEYVNPGGVMNLTARLLAGVGSALSNIVLILLTVTFILLEASSFPVKLRAVLGDPHQAFPQFTKFVQDIKRYMIIKTIISLIAGITLGLWLFVLGVDFPVLWGFLAFLLHYVPNIGGSISAIPPVFLALIELGVGPALLVAAGFLVIGFTLGNFVEPRLMGRKLGLSTLVVFLSLIAWGSLLGPIGMVLCVPLTMTLKFGLELHKDTRWIAVLLGSEKPIESIPPASKKWIDSEK